MWNFIGNTVLFSFMILLGCFYVINAYKLFKAVNAEKYSFILIPRAIGIFVVPLGVFMGFL